MFCPKCGSIMMPKKEKDKRVLVCACGYIDKSGEKTSVKEVINPEKELEVVDEGKDTHLPEIDIECPKCGNNKARFWLVQTRSGDEAETKFYKCTKCKHTWREYD